jgi:DNA-binding response OmpR family regulator
MQHKRVLLVEDDPELRRLYKEAFEHAGFDVSEAENGEEAISLVLTNKPHVVILDLMLPRQGGIAALRIMRSQPGSRNVPVIILTALPNQEYRESTKDMVQGYFLKTQIKPGDLVAAAEKVIIEH